MRKLLWGMIGLGTWATSFVSPAAAEFRFGTPGEHFLSIEGRPQLRYTSVDQSGANENSFRIRRLRVEFEGDAFPHVGYIRKWFRNGVNSLTIRP